MSREKQQQVQALGRLGWSLRRIQEATGVRRETASAYLKDAGIGVRGPGRWGHDPPKPAIEVITGSEAKPAIEVITGSGPRGPSRSPSTSACEIHRDAIEAAVARGRNAMAIYQDLVSDHGFAGGYASVMRFVRKLRRAEPSDAHVPIETSPGEESQVDYGEGPMVRSPETGKYRRTRLFVLTLAHSRKAVRLLVWKSSSRVWAELHERAFRRLGGVTRVVVLDNLREGVLRPDVYDPTLNPLYADVLKHYGAVALPCRVGDPDRKGKVESAIGHTQRTPLKGQRFESLDEAQAYLDRWDEQWADKRIHGRTKRQVAAMYAEEKPALLPLPIEPFRYYQYGERTVHLDGHVEIQRCLLLRAARLHRARAARAVGRPARPADGSADQAASARVPSAGARSLPPDEYRPKRTPATTLQLLAMAAHAGKHVGALCAAIHRDLGEVGVKRILGVRSLLRRYGSVAVDDACAAALEMGVPEYRFVRRYLERQPRPPMALRQIDPLIRELTVYRDHINRITKET